MSDLETLKEGYQNFAEGKVEEVLAIWDEKIVWHACTGLPYIKGDGVFIGPQDVLTNVLATIPEHFDDFSIEISDFIDGGEKIVMEGFYTGVYKPTGKRFKANATHTWTFKDGKPAVFFQAVDTALIINT